MDKEEPCSERWDILISEVMEIRRKLGIIGAWVIMAALYVLFVALFPNAWANAPHVTLWFNAAIMIGALAVAVIEISELR